MTAISRNSVRGSILEVIRNKSSTYVCKLRGLILDNAKVTTCNMPNNSLRYMHWTDCTVLYSKVRVSVRLGLVLGLELWLWLGLVWGYAFSFLHFNVFAFYTFSYFVCSVMVTVSVLLLEDCRFDSWSLNRPKSWSKFTFVECEFQHPKFVEFECEWEYHFTSIYFISWNAMHWFICQINDCDMLFLKVNKISLQVSTV